MLTFGFDEIHTEGAKRFGSAWLIANEQATKAFDAAGIDYSNDDNLKYAISLATYKIVQHLTIKNDPEVAQE